MTVPIDENSPRPCFSFSPRFDAYYLKFGADASVSNSKDLNDGNSWRADNNIRLTVGGVPEGLYLVNDAFSLGFGLTGLVRTTSHDNTERFGKLSFGIDTYFYPADPLSSSHMFRLGLRPLGFGFTRGIDIRPDSALKTAEFAMKFYEPVLSALYLNRESGSGLMVRATGEAGLKDSFSYSANAVSGKDSARRNAITASVEGFWMPFTGPGNIWLHGLGVYASYDRKWSQWHPLGSNPAGLAKSYNAWDTFLAGIRLDESFVTEHFSKKHTFDPTLSNTH